MTDKSIIKDVLAAHPKWSRQALVWRDSRCPEQLNVSDMLQRDDLVTRAMTMADDLNIARLGVLANRPDSDRFIRKFKHLLLVIDHEVNPFRTTSVSHTLGSKLAVPSARQDRQSVLFRTVLSRDHQTFILLDLEQEVCNNTEFRCTERRLYDYVDGLFFDQTIPHPEVNKKLDAVFGTTDDEPPQSISVNRKLSGITGILPLFIRDDGGSEYPEILKGHRYYPGHGTLSNYQVIERVLARHFDELTESVIRETVETLHRNNRYGQTKATREPDKESIVEAFGDMEWSV